MNSGNLIYPYSDYDYYAGIKKFLYITTLPEKIQ